MSDERFILFLALGLIGLRGLGQWFLTRLNQRQVEANRGTIPTAFHGMLDGGTYAKSVDYTLAKARFGQWENIWESLVLAAVLGSGLLPASWRWLTGAWGASSWIQAGWLLLVGLGLSVPSIPFEWWSQFRLEERFGFNTMTLATWVMDRLKGLVLALLIGMPLLVFLLKLVGWMGPYWWLWAWASLMAFQVVMMVLAPIFILPLFNKFTPLPDGTLRERLLALGTRTGFSARTILVMDGSKRSRHSNAYFTGFGKFRRIVLFDTLMAQLSEAELEAVLAHEVGHFKLGHIPKMLVWAGASSLLAFALIGWLAREHWFAAGFGFELSGRETVAPVLLLFALTSGLITFWFTPIANYWSRRHEYEADAFARKAVGQADPLIGALRKLSEKNLSNLTPHPWFSGFYYSHPTLIERESALGSPAGRPGA